MYQSALQLLENTRHQQFKSLFRLMASVDSVRGKLIPKQKWHGRSAWRRKVTQSMTTREQRGRKSQSKRSAH